MASQSEIEAIHLHGEKFHSLGRRISFLSYALCLYFHFEDAFEGKAEDDGQSKIDDKPVEMPSEKIHIFIWI
jgi:hypothetical protein